jgi:hypothetical protein
MRKIIITTLAVVCAGIVSDQDKKVVLFEPFVKGGSVIQIHKDILLSALEEAVTTFLGYRAFIRLNVNQNVNQKFKKYERI